MVNIYVGFYGAKSYGCDAHTLAQKIKVEDILPYYGKDYILLYNGWGGLWNALRKSGLEVYQYNISANTLMTDDGSLHLSVKIEEKNV